MRVMPEKDRAANYVNQSRPILPEFLTLLSVKDRSLVDLFIDLRSFILDIHPDSNELLYHTYALVAGFSISERASDTFCMIPVYSKHLFLGFYKGAKIEDKYSLLAGKGSQMRHLPVNKPSDYRNRKVKELVHLAIDFSTRDASKASQVSGKTISRMKK